MERHILVVRTSPKPGADQSYNDWYDGVHLPETLGIQGFVAGQRFTRSGVLTAGADPGQPYLAIYEIDTDDIEGVLAAVRAAGATMTDSDAIDRSVSTAIAFRPHGGRVVAESRG